jgi:uncharacterized protein YegP (UPF0339 family)
MSGQPRFEICRGDDGWWARFRAANGRVVWVTETYERRRAALAAINALVDPFLGCWLDSYSGQIEYRKDSWNKANGVLIEVREVDERS